MPSVADPEAAPEAPAPAPARKSTRPLQAVLILSALYFLARFTGLFQSAIIAALLNDTGTDAYSAAFDLPDFLNYLVAGGALSSTFIPLFTKFWDRGREAEAWRFFSTLASVMGVVLMGLTAFMMLFTPQLIALTKPGLLQHRETFELTVAMTRIILPAQLCFYLGGLLVGVLNTFKRFGASGWTGAVYNVAAVLVAVPLFLKTRNPLMFAWGILLGAFVGNFLLPLLAANSAPAGQRPRFRFRFEPADPAVRRFFILALPIMFGVSLPVVDQWVVGFFASSFHEGTLTHLKNANRLMIAVQGIIGQAAAVAAFPYLASEGATANYKAFSDFLRTGLRRLLFVTLPLTVLMCLWAHPIVRLVYGWGHFNDPVKIHETAVSFQWFCLGLFAWGGQALIARGFYALGDTRTPTLWGTILTFALFIPLCWIVSWTGNATLLALATTVGAAAHFFAILIALDGKMRRRKYRAPLKMEKIGGTVFRTVAACIPMTVAGYFSLWLAAKFIVDDKLGDVGLILWSGTFAGAAFVFAAHKFDIPEWNWLLAKVQRRARKRPVPEETTPDEVAA
jgi:putative peptidoglycan lipid II flippase